MDTTKIWPELADIPLDVLLAAELIARDTEYDGVREDLQALGFEQIGSGAQTVAYSNGKYVVKGSPDDRHAECPEMYFFKDIQRSRSKKLKKLVQEFVTPTLVYSRSVVIQKPVDTVAEEAGADYTSLADWVEGPLSDMLGIDDLHVYNWGFDKDMNIKVFDIGFTKGSSLESPQDGDEVRLSKALNKAIMKVNEITGA